MSDDQSPSPVSEHETHAHRAPLWELVGIAAPVVATMTSYTLMQFVDQLMVSRIGSDAIFVGAQGNGGLAAWAPIAVAMGFITVVNTFVSQNVGAKHPERAPAYAWAGLWIGVAYWALFMIPFGLLLPSIFGLLREFAPPDRVAELVRRDALASAYGQILIYGSLFTMSARGISQYFFGMHKPIVIFVASVSGNVVNFILNSFLIYGPTAPAKTGWIALDWWFELASSISTQLHIPRLLIQGSGVATVIGTVVELLIPMVLFLSPRFNAQFATRRAWWPSWPHIKDLLKLGWAPAIMFGNEMLCWGYFMVYLVGQFGKDHSTAGWIAHRWMSLSFMPTVGISVAITAMVGKCMGQKRPIEATRRARLGLWVAATYMTTCALIFIIFRKQLAGIFLDDSTPIAEREAIVALASSFLVAAAAFQFFDGVAMSLSGALKGAGDTRWPSIWTVALSWTLLVVGGTLMVKYAPGLGSLGPWIAAGAYIVALSIAIFWRFASGRWRNIALLEHSASGSEAIRA